MSRITDMEMGLHAPMPIISNRADKKELEMKLWLLQARGEELPNDDNPWKPWYDKSFGHVVRAETEDEARCIAHENAGDENLGEFMQKKTANTKHPWKDQKYSTCVELTTDGEPGLVITDYHAA